MTSEQCEFELSQLHGKRVSIVRPYYGTQSDSWSGDLYVMHGDYPYKFQFHSSINILFTAEDVSKVEVRIPTPIIRLKGPQYYITQPVGQPA